MSLNKCIFLAEFTVPVVPSLDPGECIVVGIGCPGMECHLPMDTGYLQENVYSGSRK